MKTFFRILNVVLFTAAFAGLMVFCWMTWERTSMFVQRFAGTFFVYFATMGGFCYLVDLLICWIFLLKERQDYINNLNRKL